ncbi:hypothetical protein MAR_016379 [Mya arenaria]|uniref:Uncharacterized protein n=1 Tax=Mya arenaria TaxID=6604 RepID=A0ABY7FJN7_MYAAR|nr:hypothetical protein MAR_016379 [Mya arenaria]
MMTFVLQKCTNRQSLGKLARILQFTSGFSSDKVKTISEISEYVCFRSEIEKDDETCRLVQDTFLGCLTEAKPNSDVKCMSVKVLQLSIESDLNLILSIRPETVRQLVITHHVTCQKYHISCITLMTGLTQLLIMNHNDTINAHALLSIVHGCNNLKKLELDDYDLTPFREKSLHSCMCNVTYIRLFGCTLSHTQVTNLLCETPKLADITLWAVRCVADDKCGCQDKDKQFHGEKQIGENDLQTLEENERYCRHGQVTVTTCHIYDSSQVFVHVLQSDSLTTLLIDEYEFSDDTGLEMFIPRCNKLQNLELDNIILDTRNIITIIKNAKPGAELQVKLNKTQVLGGDASHLENALDALPFVDVASFTANDNEIIRASIIVSKPREVRDVDMNNDDQSSDDEERPLLDQHIDVLDSSDVCFEMMTMSERKNNNTSCCECTLL